MKARFVPGAVTRAFAEVVQRAVAITPLLITVWVADEHKV
jgi:hypothetical protein